MVFSDTVNNLGIVQQARSMMRVDANQWPTYKIVNSCNNWFDFLVPMLIASDKRFNWDDTNYTDLPSGSTTLTANTSTYSFLTDQNGARILNLISVSVETPSGDIQRLELVNQRDLDDNFAEAQGDGIPKYYDKITDNIIKLFPSPNYTVAGGLYFDFQRTPSYFSASDTTKQPGVATPLHRGFVIAAAYDGALAMGLPNLQALAAERQLEEQKAKDYLAIRNTDETRMIKAVMHSAR